MKIPIRQVQVLNIDFKNVLQFEVIFDLLKIYLNNNRQKADYLKILTHETSIFLDSKIFDRLFQKSKLRHSFFLKSIWCFALIFKHNYGNNAKLGQAEGSHLIKMLKSQAPVTFRERNRSFRNSILLKPIKLFDYNRELKYKNYSFLSHILFWLNYNRIQNQFIISQYEIQNVCEYINRNYSSLLAA